MFTESTIKRINDSIFKKKEIARLTGISISQFSHLMSGRRKPSQLNMQRLASFFRVPIEDLQ